MPYFLHLTFVIGILILIILSKKFNFLLDSKVEDHKNIVSTDNSYFLGGIIIMIFFSYYLIINKEIFKFLFFFSIFLIGIVSDFKIINDPKKRFLLQLLTILFFVVLLDIKIPPTRWTQLDLILKENFVNYFFVTFCLMVLINGSNFVDGINTLLVSYYLIIFALLFLTRNYFDYNLIINLILLLLLIFILNITGLIILGDSGSYLLSIFAGIFLIDVSKSFTVSPFFIILLLWYPCFELLFSMIRRSLLKLRSYEPDTKHLHQMLYKSVKKTNISRNTKINHFMCSFLINFYNILSFYIGVQFISHTKSLVLIIVINILNYLFIYNYLKKNT